MQQKCCIPKMGINYVTGPALKLDKARDGQGGVFPFTITCGPHAWIQFLVILVIIFNIISFSSIVSWVHEWFT